MRDCKTIGLMRLIILLATLVAGFSGNASAEAIVFKCDFAKFYSPDNQTTRQVYAPFEMTFSYDTLTKDAFLTGNNGVSRVGAYSGTDGVTFYELLNSGAIQTTTIQLSDLSTVHSRHSMLLGVIVPSQYYGTCSRQ